MFESIIAAVGGKFIDGFFTSALQAFTAYQNKQISEAQLKEQLLQAMLQSARDIETAAYDALVKTYASFMGAVEKSAYMQHVWGAVTISQAFVLVWYQFFVPLITLVVHQWFSPTWHYPSAGATVEWAYLLLAGLMGMGPAIMRAGPAAGNLLERMRAALPMR